MKNIIASLLTLSIFLSQAHADICCEDNSHSFYAEIFGGANFLQTTKQKNEIKVDYETGYMISGSLGRHWDYGLRIEAEYSYRRNCVRKGRFFCYHFKLPGKFQSSSYMANVIWSPSLSSLGFNCWNIKPFVGGGIGYDFQRTYAKNEGIIFNRSRKGFAWQIVAGLAYPIFCNTDLSLEYKFHKGKFKHLYNHTVGIGLTYSFGLNS